MYFVIFYRLEKDYTQRQSNFLSQREKLEENFKRDEEKLIIRKSDLDKQLLNMQEKFKVDKTCIISLTVV